LRDRDTGSDLVVIALPGVQRFIAEARSTADVSAASEIYSALAGRVIGALRRAGAEPVLPQEAAVPAEGLERIPRFRENAAPGLPNRVVALLPSGSGADAAKRASEAAYAAWRDWVRQVLPPADGRPAPATPGFPCVQWVCVPPDRGGYAAQWKAAQRTLAARRRVHDFEWAEWRQRALCSLAPRWPAEEPPKGLKEHEKATLSAVGWVKRRWRDIQERDGSRPPGFPSTPSIASAPYRHAVLRRLDEPQVSGAVRAMEDAHREIGDALGTGGEETPVPGLSLPPNGPGRWFARSGGPWAYPERWRAEALVREAGMDPARGGSAKVTEIADAVRRGREAARRLRELMEKPGDGAVRGGRAVRLASYLAVMVQDLDSMGLFLSGIAGDAAGRKIGVSPDEHRRVSGMLLEVAAQQREVLRRDAQETGPLFAVPVYAGGDDLLAFTPAAMALDTAQACHGTIAGKALPHASTAVLFFHYRASIQQAMSEARRLLDNAKEHVRGKHALAVGYLRRSGVSAASVQPWPGRDGGSSVDMFGIFAREREHRLSPRLAADLERDAGELASLPAVSDRLYRAELARLVRRHSGAGPGGDRDAAERVARALDWLGEHERAPGHAGRPRPELAARVGVFLRQEAQ